MSSLVESDVTQSVDVTERSVAPSQRGQFRFSWDLLFYQYWGIVFPGVITAVGIFLMRQFFDGVPNELLDAARIDGMHEFGFVQISSIMPQKRNPVVLEHLRARLSRALGFAQTVVIQCHNIPYGDTQDIEDEILPPLFRALDSLQEAVELYTALFETLTLNVNHLQQRAGEGFTTATELADTLVREAGLSFRSAHQIVAAMVQDAVKVGLNTSQLTLAMLQQAAQKILGRPLPLNEIQFKQALNPLHFVHLRNGPGGVAPAATKAALDELKQLQVSDMEAMAMLRQRLTDAQTQRQQAAVALSASIANAKS